MKLLVEFRSKQIPDCNWDGIILPLVNYAVLGKCYYNLDEIENIAKKYKDREIFVSLNKNFFNDDIVKLKEILQELDKIGLTGIFFYDLAVLQLKNSLNLKTDLVWNQTHMVNNYRTCDYYFTKGVKYALLGKEITLSEIKEIITKTSAKCMVEVLSKPSVAFSKRKLLTNYYTDLKKPCKNELTVLEKITNEKYLVKEEKDGTAFYKDKIINGTSIIKDLYEVNCDYIIMRDDLENEEEFYQLINDTYKYIDGNCNDEEYVLKYKKLGDYTNFFFNKTIYKVKKNG